MASNPEKNDGSRLSPSETDQARILPDNVGSHLMIGVLFGFALASNPRRTLRVIRSHGIGSIPKGYRTFYKNVRPDISY